MKATTRGNAFFIYILPSPNVKPCPHEIPFQYQEFKDVLEKKNVDTLPKYQPYDCAIDLVEGTQPPFGPIYNLSQDKLLMFREHMYENLEKRFIRHSKSLASAPILFVKKKDGSFRMCVDYHGFNQFTIKNWYPLPLTSRLLDQLTHAKVYTKIDLCGTYNLVHIQEDNEWKIMFKTLYDHFGYVVVPFGLTNMPTVFQHLMNVFFHRYLDDFMICYIDDIFIFSKNMEDHDRHVCSIFEKLQKVGLYAKFEL